MTDRDDEHPLRSHLPPAEAGPDVREELLAYLQDERAARVWAVNYGPASRVRAAPSGLRTIVVYGPLGADETARAEQARASGAAVIAVPRGRVGHLGADGGAWTGMLAPLDRFAMQKLQEAKRREQPQPAPEEEDPP